MDKNKKRYVYLDKYIDFQANIVKELSVVKKDIIVLYVLMAGLITGLTVLLYKLFG